MSCSSETKMPHVTTYKCLACLLKPGMMRSCATSSCECGEFLSSRSTTYCKKCAIAKEKCCSCGNDLLEPKKYFDAIIQRFDEYITTHKSSNSDGSLRQAIQELESEKKLIIEHFSGDISKESIQQTLDKFIDKLLTLIN